MKWKKETQVYMFAHYYSEDGNWEAWDESIIVKGGSNKKFYNKETKRMEKMDSWKHVWFLENIKTGEKVAQEFKTLKAAKIYAEAQ